MTRRLPNPREILSRPIVREVATFGLVGGAGFLVDVGVFNLLAYTVFLHSGTSGLLVAKGVSTTLAIVANWVGNRLLTFRSHRRSDVAREALEFGAVSLAGGAIALGCLWVSHDAMHLTSPLADNVSANIVGLALGSAFRFVLYRFWVYGPRRAGTELSTGTGPLPVRVEP